MTEIPDGTAGTFKLSEPSLMPEPSLLLFLNVTVNVAGFEVEPPGATTAGLLAVQPVWPFPQITTE